MPELPGILARPPELGNGPSGLHNNREQKPPLPPKTATPHLAAGCSRRAPGWRWCGSPHCRGPGRCCARWQSWWSNVKALARQGSRKGGRGRGSRVPLPSLFPRGSQAAGAIRGLPASAGGRRGLGATRRGWGGGPSAERIRREHRRLAKEKCWDGVMLEHQLRQLLPLGPRVPLEGGEGAEGQKRAEAHRRRRREVGVSSPIPRYLPGPLT